MAKRNRNRKDRQTPQFKFFQVFRVNKVPDGPLGDRLMTWMLRDYS
ncbi:hypothetical protein A6764_15230 [Brevibacillus sp. WF146]|jgi:hypothetical protein|nr:hypothetical protein [Brevibacillus sp. WF146]UYZ12176.1 hypothetical protein A6764_15230 [Brevibacillus sp. WF146]